jgi:hypothetical protein
MGAAMLLGAQHSCSGVLTAGAAAYEEWIWQHCA